MSHPCEQNRCIFADPEKATQVAVDLQVIRKQVELYLGNGEPGILPKQMEKISEKVDSHEAFINQHQGQHKGSSLAWTTLRLILIPLIVSVIGAAVTLWARAH